MSDQDENVSTVVYKQRADAQSSTPSTCALAGCRSVTSCLSRLVKSTQRCETYISLVRKNISTRLQQ